MKRQVLKDAKNVVNETKKTLSEIRTTEPRRSPRLRKSETARNTY